MKNEEKHDKGKDSEHGEKKPMKKKTGAVPFAMKGKAPASVGMGMQRRGFAYK